jgi:hypothetical protein
MGQKETPLLVGLCLTSVLSASADILKARGIPGSAFFGFNDRVPTSSYGT